MMTKIQIGVSPDLKVAVSAMTLCCPECRSKAIVKLHGNHHCNNCGTDFGGTAPAPVAHGQRMGFSARTR